MDIEQIKTDMNAAAATAATAYLAYHYGGRDQGACGFAWVTIYPEHDGRTAKGKAERKAFAQLGAEPHWIKGQYMIWNPAKVGAQNVDCKERGAWAAVKVLREAGINASAGSRLD